MQGQLYYLARMKMENWKSFMYAQLAARERCASSI